MYYFNPQPGLPHSLAFGNINEICLKYKDDADVAIVHACKEPCHRHAAGYRERSLDKAHPHYLSLQTGKHLYLNLIDPPVPLFQLESFQIFLDFTAQHIEDRPVYIHCNLGQSRAPSLALLYLSKRAKVLPDRTYADAARGMNEMVTYNPSAGIKTFLSKNWERIY